ncbi:helix-turn-helix domain-containing protein [Streptomyces cellostaticus]|uniref:helix-turn-helix domain-containing protein n=1 Tax=Streptomyces cellostaticus TaxID=67285 RepID=UPI0020260426|nr:helix-turn-helix domain-containing protein [Streptomyces cellostaticus]
MDTENRSAPLRAQSRVVAKNHPNRRSAAGGLIHDNTRHSTRFTVIGNHLAQHPRMSGLAIGLGVHIQSLPAGSRVDIRTLTARFPEGAVRIAAALRELEAHGYLRRERKRGSDGRIVTRTVSCNQPGLTGDTSSAPPSRKASPPRKKKAVHRALPPVPGPARPSPALVRQATDLLAELRRHDFRLLLSARDTAHLAPGVAAWLEREATPSAVRHALTTNLPDEPLCRPAALLAHRLAAGLPAPPPFRAPAPPPAVRHPLQNCEGCDRAFRSPDPGLCSACRPTPPQAAQRERDDPRRRT